MTAAPRNITRHRGSEVEPPSFAQQRFWVLDQLAPGNAVFHSPCALRLIGKLDVDALTDALRVIVDRHEALRTALFWHDGNLAAQPLDGARVPLAHVALTAPTPQEREAELALRMRAEACRPFALSRGENLRATLYSLTATEHVLLVVMHHTACDGWSKRILTQELAALYSALSLGAPSPLPELPVQYRDYARWQRSRLTGALLEQKLAYWRGHLAGAEAGVALPTDRPRPRVRRYHGQKQWLSLSGTLYQELRELARSQRVTLFITMMAAFKALLYRYTGQVDLIVGTTVACRTRPEVEGLIGLFMNTLFLRTYLADRPSFTELLARERAATLLAYDHQDVPVEKLIEELHPARNTSHSPFTQVMFQLEAPTKTPAFADLEVRDVELDLGAAREDLILAFVEKDGALRGKIEYDTDLFAESTATRFLTHYQTVLEQVVSNPAQRVHELALLTAQEREQVVYSWNQTRAAYPRTASIPELLRAQGPKHPQAPAVIFEGQVLTYRELHSQSNQLGRLLRRRGVGPGSLVGLAVERSLDLVISLLAILKAGAAYVPLDPSYPKERLAFMIADAGLSLLLVQDQQIASLPGHTIPVLSLDAARNGIAAESAEDLQDAVAADALAYVIYTSGSTGVPKGVEVTHRAVGNFLCAMQAQLGIGPSDVLVAVTSICFDIAGLELFLPILAGARLVLASREVAADGIRLAALLEKDRQRCTLFQATPSTFRLLIEAGWQGTARLTILCGGEALPAELSSALWSRCGALWNMYGPTETTIWSCAYRIPGAAAPVLIGSPIENTQVYVVDNHLQPVPLGLPGELLIGGDGVARGYRHRPAETAERFIPDPFCKRGGRLYKTGDRARFQPSGHLEFLGRVDDQIKIRGHRIEPAEVAASLRRHPDVTQAAVLTQSDASHGAVLVACVVAAPGKTITAQALRSFLKERLPDVMVPATFLFVDAMPLTPNGKLDRPALLARSQSLPPEHAEVFVAPHGPIQTALAVFFQELLQLPQVSATSDFFALGGHSLLAMQLLGRIRAAFAVDLPLRRVFDTPTLAALAHVINASQTQLLADRDRLLSDLENLTEADAERLLAADDSALAAQLVSARRPG